ncbi:hypothetical protein HYFRA_00012041 [Hymenoscyphus fraxineus]|uniref:Uncharacterized protein n=1 Tax=Hymenoscyphus fraxineus TaxID=746836 RepID=A0A9N9KZ44_9HELO|nr:hypothetical protein HYFRA_00012041 [Hymenoscyphus fraxineus]
MHYHPLVVAILAAYGVAIPLNINLGAYSPAVIVGDGEISFGGRTDVSGLMSALEGAAVGGTGTGTAPNANPNTPKPSAAAAPGQITDQQQAAQIAALQGMGKQIAPREGEGELEAREPEPKPEVVTEDKVPTLNSKRDINGFNAALKYASDAIKVTPQIDIGTPEAGVGILQRPGITAAAAAGAGGARPGGAAGAAGGAPAGAHKTRDLPARKMKTTVTTMYVRGGPVPAGTEKRSVGHAALSKKDSSTGLDGVNLNMADGQVAELTFVETKAVEADEEDSDDEE